MAAILAVRLAESSLELRLFHQGDVEEVEHQECNGPNAVWRRQQDEALTEQNEDHSRDHGVANEAVRSADDQRARWVPGRQGASSLDRKQPQRGEEEKQAHGEESEANQLEGSLQSRLAENESHPVPLRDPERHENRHRTGQNRDREKMSQQIDHYPHSLRCIGWTA